MLKQSTILISNRYNDYNKLNNANKEKISESIGSVGYGLMKGIKILITYKINDKDECSLEIPREHLK